ncbi:MAG: 3-dehydroquinate dehydratase [Bacteroidetes bacterium]|nr:3-dehydroquinate dehydratase [Bacteroidota bacterium]
MYIINGPNLNLQGVREPSVYGVETFDDLLKQWRQEFEDLDINYFQSNVEGELINKLHEVGFTAVGIILNSGGYSHTSVAIADAIAAITSPVLEVHISNLYKRETYRHVSLTAANCIGLISGFGLEGYKMALNHFAK